MNIFENSHLLKEFKVDDSTIKDLNLIDMTNDEIQKSSEIIIYCDLIFTNIKNLLNRTITVDNGSTEIKKNDDILQYRQKGLIYDIGKDDIEIIKNSS